MSRAWTKLINTQTKDVTSSDLMKLSQLMYIDPNAIKEFEALTQLMTSVKVLQSPGQNIFADSLQLSTQTINNETATFKPSTIYDGEPFASDYLVQLLAISATVGDGDTGGIQISLTDGSNSLLLSRATAVTFSGPFSLVPANPVYLNESNYLSIINAASVDMPTVVYCALVARGGA
jgi:hypothetical protein